MMVRLIRLAIAVMLCCGPVGVSAQEQVARDPGYLVGIGDVIDVETFGHEDISGEFTVAPSGVIVFPLLGSVPVAGNTPADIANFLESALEKDYYVDVQLTVAVKVFASQPVTLLGEIENPGTYYLQGRTSLTDLLARAGGLKPSAGPTLELRRVTRVNGEGPPPPMEFATSEILSGEAGRDVYLESGDVVSVAPKKLYFISGEVAKSGQYEITLGMTLMQAISQAGGVGKFASQSVEVHRTVDGQKKILTFDMAHIRKGRIEDPPIRAGDVIYVKRRFF
jgi:polysaccharide export outer membrane protein